MIVNPLIWYAERELKFVPRHFVKCPTPINEETKHWIQNKTSGRYAFADAMPEKNSITASVHVYFEDEKEATMYELIWARAN